MKTASSDEELAFRQKERDKAWPQFGPVPDALFF